MGGQGGLGVRFSETGNKIGKIQLLGAKNR